MKKPNYLLSFLITIFSIFLCWWIFPPQTVNADYTFDDGITNWSQKTQSQVGELPIADNLSLGYAFGLAQNTSGKVTTGGDSSITTYSLAGSINNVNYSKMNVFLNNNGSYYSSVFQTGYQFGGDTAQQQVSLTSPDFLLAPSTSTKSITARDFSILGVLASNNGNTGMTNKKYFVGTDKNGNPAYKIVGDFTRTSGSANNGVYNLKAELLLRASPTNAAIVHRELYLYNPTETTQTFTILFGEDTKMGSSDGKADMVPIYDLGNKLGLYIKDDSGTNNYRLMVTNALPDGFKYYNGQAYSSDATGNNWAKGLTPANVSGVGAEAKNNPNGTDLLNRSVDTSYVLRWDSTTLKPGESAHYGSTMGVTAKPYSVPSAQKTYTNQTSTDGKNRIGDKLKFNLKMTNNGYGARWGYKQLTDEIPEGLQIDPTTLKLITTDGTQSDLDSTNYDASTRILTVPTNKVLTDDQSVAVTFEANITNNAMQNLDADNNLINSAQFTGIDENVEGSTDKTYSAEVQIPIEPPSFNFSFTKQLRNTTNGETDYQDSTTARKGDIIDYKIIYQVASDSKDYLTSGARLTDTLPDGIERTADQATITGPDGNTYPSDSIETNIIEVLQGQSVIVEFKAVVTAASAGKVTNIANVTGGVTSANQKPGDMVSNGAVLNIQDSDAFTSVPTLIDFGSANMYGQTQTLTNIGTTGQLIVSHPTASPFRVNVSYDNDDPTSQFVNNANQTLPSDDSGLLFIRQRDTHHSDSGTWTPITKNGTSIQTATFDGSQDSINLTNYVGVGDWQIKLAANANTGAYKGTLTWSMVDGI